MVGQGRSNSFFQQDESSIDIFRSNASIDSHDSRTYEAPHMNVFNMDQYFEATGGYGKYQKLNTFLAVVIALASNFFLFNVSFYQLVPKLECSDSPDSLLYFTCSKDDVCNARYGTWQIDWSDEISLKNPLTEYGLLCAPPMMLGLLGGMTMLGVVIGSFLVVRIADKQGRVDIVKYNNWLMCAVYLALLYVCHDVKTLYMCAFVSGVTVSVCYNVVFVWALESIPSEMRTFTGTFINLIINAIFVFSALFFLYVSRDWKMSFYPCLGNECFLRPFRLHSKGKSSIPL